MKKFICSVCGYVYEGEEAPEKCPQCGAPKDKFTVMGEGKKEYADEHVLGVAKGVDERVIEGLRQNFTGECSEVGMYLAMSRVAFREGYPEVGLYYEKAAHEEAEHASKFAEMLGEVLSDSTKKNLEMRAAAEQVPAKERKNWLPWLNSLRTTDASMILFMKCAKTKLVMAVPSTPCWLVISANNHKSAASSWVRAFCLLWQNFGKWIQASRYGFVFIKNGLIHGLIPVWMLTIHLLVFVLSS